MPMVRIYDCGENHNNKDKNDKFLYSLAAGISGAANIGYGIKTVLDGNETREFYTADPALYTEPGNGVEMKASDVWGFGIAAVGATLMWRNRHALKKALTKVARVPAKMYSFYRACVDEVEQERQAPQQMNNRYSSRDGY